MRFSRNKRIRAAHVMRSVGRRKHVCANGVHTQRSPTGRREIVVGDQFGPVGRLAPVVPEAQQEVYAPKRREMGD